MSVKIVLCGAVKYLFKNLKVAECKVTSFELSFFKESLPPQKKTCEFTAIVFCMKNGSAQANTNIIIGSGHNNVAQSSFLQCMTVQNFTFERVFLGRKA